MTAATARRAPRFQTIERALKFPGLTRSGAHSETGSVTTTVCSAEICAVEVDNRNWPESILAASEACPLAERRD
jgi:hypothetical protein